MGSVLARTSRASGPSPKASAPMPRRSVAALALAVAALVACRQASREDVARELAVNDSIAAAVHRSLRTGVKKETSEVFMESSVEEPPEVLSGPTLRYPAWLREQGIQGRVVVQFIVDSLGRAEPSSVKVIQTPNAGLDQPAMNYVLRARFRPGIVHGRPVRVLINLPIDFKVTQ